MYARQVVSLAQNKLQRDASLNDESGRYWAEVVDRRFQFDVGPLEVKALLQVGKEKVLQLFEERIGVCAKEGRHLAVLVTGMACRARRGGGGGGKSPARPGKGKKEGGGGSNPASPQVSPSRVHKHQHLSPSRVQQQQQQLSPQVSPSRAAAHQHKHHHHDLLSEQARRTVMLPVEECGPAAVAALACLGGEGGGGEGGEGAIPFYPNLT